MRRNILFFLFTLIGYSTSVLAGSTELIIRGPDDNPLHVTPLRVSIPRAIQNGPDGDNITVMTAPGQKAERDNVGNFLRYYLDEEGNHAPFLIVKKSEQGRDGYTYVTVSELFEGEETPVPGTFPLYSSWGTYTIVRPKFTYSAPIAHSDLLSPIREHRTFRPISINKSGKPIIERPVTEMPFFGAVSVYGTVWSVFDMYQRDVNALENKEVAALWERRNPTRVYPFMTPEEYEAEGFPVLLKHNYDYFTGNAFYFNKGGYHTLCFFPVLAASPGDLKSSVASKPVAFTSQYFGIATHESGHNALHIMRPDLTHREEAEIQAFDETVGDVTTLFATASHAELRRHIVEATGGNLHESSILSVLSSLVRRDAAGRTDTAITPSCEGHALSESLTRSVYGILAEAFNTRKVDIMVGSTEPSLDQQTDLLGEVATHVRRLFLKTTLQFSFEEPNFANFGRELRKVARQTQAFSYLYGFVTSSFFAHGIDLNNTVWSTVCIPVPPEPKATVGVDWLCSTSSMHALVHESHAYDARAAKGKRGYVGMPLPIIGYDLSQLSLTETAEGDRKNDASDSTLRSSSPLPLPTGFRRGVPVSMAGSSAPAAAPSRDQFSQWVYSRGFDPRSKN